MASIDMDMADDSESVIAGEPFGQKRPPLSVIIEGILEKYPDGQIFKVKSVVAT